MKYSDLTEAIIQAFYSVYNALGHGFLEKVYENAMAIELRERGLKVHQQAPITVFYHEYPVGEYFADLLVEERIVVELKATEVLRDEHSAQLLNYLRGTGIEVGLLFNFGSRPDIRRKTVTPRR
ncbi:MAG: GxxExxY protein [Armatimonadetes bacterium]|nr:GxxExxY protein [Armatimonadota bacterium]